MTRTLAAFLFLLFAADVRAQRPVGIDVSDYQSTSLNWSTLKNTYGISFGWAKASEGAGLAMANFTTYESKAKAAGVYIGAYHFARYDLDPGLDGATAEANFFWDTAKNYLKDGGYYLMPMLDVEADFSGYTKTTLSAWVNQWCAAVVNKALAAGYVVKPCIYCSSSHAANYFNSSVTQWIPYMADWNGESKQNGGPAFAPWAKWTFWQYDDQNVAQAITTGDGDVFNGTIADLTSTMLITSAVVDHWAGGDTNLDWITDNNWDNSAPGTGDTVLFDNTNALPDFGTNCDNIVGENYTVGRIIYSNWTYSAAAPLFSSHHAQISAGKTLTVKDGIVVGVSSANGKGFTNNPLTYAAISGPGTLAVTGGDVNVGYQSSESATEFVYALFDLSGLYKFTFTDANGTFGIASAMHRRQGGEVNLAGTNTITASEIFVGIGVTGVGTHAGLLHLGQSNVLNCSTLTVGQDAEGDLDFEDGLANPSLRLRNIDGSTGIPNAYFGATYSAGSTWGRGTNDLTAGTVDANITNLYVALHEGDISGATQGTIDSLLVGPSPANSFVVRTLTIGSDPGGPTATKTSRAIGLLDMQNGTFIANKVVVGSAANAGTGNGTLNLHGGSLTTAALSLGISTSNGIAYGIVALDGGVMRVNGNVTVGNNAAHNAGGEIDVTNATFGVTGHLGATNIYLSGLRLDGATLELGNYSSVSIYASNLAVAANSTLRLTNTDMVAGRFPLVAYQSLSGTGVAGWSVSVPDGIFATLADNPAAHTVDLVVTGTPATPPILTGCAMMDSNTFLLTGSGLPNQPYHVYFTTNLALPMPQWLLLGATNADANGAIQFVDQTAAAQRFYRFTR